MSSAIEVQGVETLLLLFQLMLCSLVAESMKMCMQCSIIYKTCQGSSSHFSRLHNRDPAPENRPFRSYVDTVPAVRYSVRLNFQLASNSWIGSNQNTISYVQPANPLTASKAYVGIQIHVEDTYYP